MKQVLLYIWRRRTTVVGYLGVILGVLAVSDGMFSAAVTKWIVLGNGVLTACIGHHNNHKLKKAGALE